jgi:hypothetical protein
LFLYLYCLIANCACESGLGKVFLPLSLGLGMLLLFPVIIELPPLLVYRANQCIGPGPEFGDSSIPIGDCGPVSADAHN